RRWWLRARCAWTAGRRRARPPRSAPARSWRWRAWRCACARGPRRERLGGRGRARGPGDGLSPAGVRPPGAPAQPGGHCLGRHRRAAAAAPRPGAAAGGGGPGLCAPRKRGAGGGDRAAQPRARPARPRRARPRGRRAGTGAHPPARPARGLSRTAGQRELPRPAVRPGGRGGTPAVRTALLQRRGARPQRPGAARPRRAGGARLRLPRGGVLPGRGRQPRRARRGPRAMSAGRTRLPGWLLAALLALSALAPAQAYERILRYDTEVVVAADGSLEVTEHIRVRAEGDRIRRGIYRDFPTRYRDRHGNHVRVGFEVLGVERDGRPEPWFTERRNNGVRLNTGDDRLLPAPLETTYTLRYRTTHQLGFFEAHDELYWNAIGHGWEFPVERGTTVVRLPAPVPADAMEVDGWTGAQGARGKAFQAEVAAPGVVRWRLAAPLAPREGFTVLVAFPKGLVPAPTRAQTLLRLLVDNLSVLAALLGLGGISAYCLARWRAVGRDPRPGVVIVRYAPPRGESPSALRYMVRRGYDTTCMSADLLDCAVQGAIDIEREDR